MAEVFLACTEDQFSGDQLVVVKRALPALAEKPEFREMFVRESTSLARLHHPNIVRYLGTGEGDNGVPFLAMEYVHGKDLRSIVRACRRQSKRIPLANVVSIGIAICDALEAVHRAEIIHSDVSSPNVVVSYRGETKLVDFGVAQAAPCGTVNLGTPKGKVLYMSPEQAMGVPADNRSDIFSAGAVLYELLALCTPFQADNDYLSAKKLLLGEIEPLSEHTSYSVPAQLEEVVRRALQRDRQDRYFSAAGLKNALMEFAADHRIQPSGKTLGRWLRDLCPPYADEVEELEQPEGNTLVDVEEWAGGVASTQSFELEVSDSDEEASPRVTPGRLNRRLQ